MNAVITKNGPITNTNCAINGGTCVAVAVRGDRGLKRRPMPGLLGKHLLSSHRSFAAAAVSPPAAAMPVVVPAMSMRYQQTECSSPRWQMSAAFELPPAAWAALVIARAL